MSFTPILPVQPMTLPKPPEARTAMERARARYLSRVRWQRRRRWLLLRKRIGAVWRLAAGRSDYMKPSSRRASSDIMSMPH